MIHKANVVSSFDVIVVVSSTLVAQHFRFVDGLSSSAQLSVGAQIRVTYIMDRVH